MIQDDLGIKQHGKKRRDNPRNVVKEEGQEIKMKGVAKSKRIVNIVTYAKLSWQKGKKVELKRMILNMICPF